MLENYLQKGHLSRQREKAHVLQHHLVCLFACAWKLSKIEESHCHKGQKTQ